MEVHTGGENAIEEQHHLGPFTQHSHANDDRQRGQWPIARRDGSPHGADLARQFPPMARHPGVVPGQHADGGQQNCGVEQLRPRAIEQRAQFSGECRHEAGPQRPADHTSGYP